MDHKIELIFDTDELKELFTSWLLDGGGEHNFIEHLNDSEGLMVTTKFSKDKDQINVIFLGD